MACPTPRELEDKLGAEGLLDLDARAALLGHLRRCRKCKALAALLSEMEVDETREEARRLDKLRKPPRALLHRASQIAGPGSLPHIVPSPEERREMDRRRVRPPPPRWKLPAAGLSALAVAAAVLLAVRPGDPSAELGTLQREARALEPLMSGVAYAPYAPERGPRDETAFDLPLRKLLQARERRRAGAERALAMLFLLRGGGGDADRVDRALAAAGEGADADNDRGVALFARGDHVGALEQFDRALAADGRHRAARFNRALALSRLGLRPQAAEAFEASADGSPLGREAGDRARRERSRPPAALPATARLESLRALFGASKPAEVQAVQARLASMPQGLVADLAALARWAAALPAAQLEAHFELWKAYLTRREDAMKSRLDPAEAERFAAAADGDRILWAPALQLAAYVRQTRGEWRAAQAVQSRLVETCRARGCPVENQAIALDELADAAGRDGDFASAHRLQDGAQALLLGVDAELQLSELNHKRAALLAEEGRAAEAVTAAEQAMTLLQDWPATSDAAHVQGVALAFAAQLASQQGRPRAALELREAALALYRKAGAAGEEAEVSAQLAQDAAALGRAGDARVQLDAEIARLEQLGHANGVAELRAALADLLERQGQPQAAAAEAERGLAAAADAWTSTRARLILLHARALRALGREGEATGELSAALDKAASTGEAGRAEALASELAAAWHREGRPVEELALPLDKLRSTALGVPAAQPGWSGALAAGSCVLAVSGTEGRTLVALIWRGGGEARLLDHAPAEVAPAQLLEGVERRCSPAGELWLFSSAPIDLAAAPVQGVPLSRWTALGLASSLTRALAPEPAAPPAQALLVRDAQAEGDVAGAAVALPASADERKSLQQLAPDVRELAGRAATPEAVLAEVPAAPLVHFAVHGFEGPEGGALQLAGAAGRLPASELAALRLQPGARVVLAACDAASPGPRGLLFAFARAGAVAVVAARGRVDDAAAARWARGFYAALARGRSFAQANHDAATDPRGAQFVVMK